MLGILLLSGTNVMASIEIDGIYYELSNRDNTASVTYSYNSKKWPGLYYKGDIVIPSKITHNSKEYVVTTIGEEAFYYSSSMTSISIPNSVTTIENSAFKDCPGLTSIFIPSSVTSIGETVFSGNRLTNIVVDDGNQTYDSRENCNAIILTSENRLIAGCAKTIIPGNVTGIGNYAFSGCVELASILIPNSVTSIGNYAFGGCIGLRQINIPNSVNSIGSGAFSECSYLWNVNIPQGITKIEAITFYSCTSLRNIIIPNGVTSIDRLAFAYTHLESLHLPISVQSISSEAFHGSYVKEVYSDSIFFYFGREQIYSVSDYSIPDGIKVIASYAFGGTTIETLRIPESVTKICRGAIGSMSLRKIILGENIGDIENDAFRGLSKECEIFVPRNTMSILTLWRNCTNLENVMKDPDNGEIIYKYGVKPVSATSIMFEEFIPKDSNVTVSSQKWELVRNGKKEVVENGGRIMGLCKEEVSSVSYELKYRQSASQNYTIKKISWDISSIFPSIQFLSSQPKVISSGNVIVGAESNIDDDEINVGFEWRRADWTDEFPSNTGVAYLYDGMMEGYIRNLNTEKLWKFRPYYESSAGNRYYGEWMGLDPTNTSYFEPTVHTYDKIDVNGNTATVKGYVMRGTDDIVSQGFVYWSTVREAKSLNSVGIDVEIPQNAVRVKVNGQVMKTTLTGLEYGKTYTYAAYLTTSKGSTYYGERQTFSTDSQSTDILSINAEEENGCTILRNSTSDEQIYNVTGQKLERKPTSGIYIQHGKKYIAR